jgi:hypothetical protein
MTEAVADAYRMAQQGYGWEDIQAAYPMLTQKFCWAIVQSVEAK